MDPGYKILSPFPQLPVSTVLATPARWQIRRTVFPHNLLAHAMLPTGLRAGHRAGRVSSRIFSQPASIELNTHP